MKNKITKITKEMLENFDNAIKAWKFEDGDYGDPKSMKKVYAADRRQLNTVYHRIVHGEYALAGNYARGLDTILRDIIPNDIYDVIMKASENKDSPLMKHFMEG